MLIAFEVGLCVFCLLAVIYGVLELHYGLKKLPPLSVNETLSHHVAELVSIVMVVKDEAKHLKNCLERILAQDYPVLEIIVVNDRSTDKSADIVQSLQKEYGNLHLVTISVLPNGWLGKNHAMYQGAKAARGKWLLFLDGDVYFAKQAVSLGMAYLQQNDRNNLTLLPEFERKSFWLDALIAAGALAFYFKLKPWRAKQQSTKYFAGVGTYNLMLRDMYFSFDGHRSFPMCILDDAKLGKKLKLAGAKQICLDGKGLISIHWYETVYEMFSGTEKNSFAHCRFNCFNLLCESILGLTLFIWPIIALFIMSTPLKWLNFITIALTMFLYWDYAKEKNLSSFLMFSYPFAVLLGTYAWWLATIHIKLCGGVRWRDTFYPLEALKKDLL